MNTSLTASIDVGCLLASAVFVAHIAGNLSLSRPGDGAVMRFSRLSLFPPAWVFAIWLLLWGLQGLLLWRTYGTGFWTPLTTVLFVLMCAGNIGSQLAGVRRWTGAAYLLLLGVMWAASLAFWMAGTPPISVALLFDAAAQAYVGWASVAFLVGLGVVLVCDREVVPDAIYSRAGLVVLSAVPLILWALWAGGRADLRLLSTPFLLVLAALALRVGGSGGKFLQKAD